MQSSNLIRTLPCLLGTASSLFCFTLVSKPAAAETIDRPLPAAGTPAQDIRVTSATAEQVGQNVVPVPTATELLPLLPLTTAQTPTDQSTPTNETNPEDVPPGNGEVLSEIRVQFVNKNGQPVTGRTRPSVITREFDLKPGDTYDPQRARAGLERLSQLEIVRRASLSLEPAADGQAALVVNVVERSNFFAAPGTASRSPSALQGPFQAQSVDPLHDESTGFAVDGRIGFRNLGGGNDQRVQLQSRGGQAPIRRISVQAGSGQRLQLQVRGGERVLDTELSFTNPWIVGDRNHTGYSINLFNQRAVQGVFQGGDRDVNLPTGNTPWVHRLGGGVEVFRTYGDALTVAAGITYQRVSVRNRAFDDRVYSHDEDGNRLTVSNTGNDDLLLARIAADYDRRNSPDNPTEGFRILAGLDQSIPIGDASITFTRITGNYLHYLPLNLFGFAPGPRTLVLNLQAGTMLGDVPPYEAFNFDSGPVQGFNGVSFGTGSSFVTIAAEYRFPIANFTIFRQDVQLGGMLFGGYISDLGTASDVIGRPAIVREKPGDGFSYGFGLRATTPIGIVRAELGFTDRGDSEFVVTTGDRF